MSSGKEILRPGRSINDTIGDNINDNINNKKSSPDTIIPKEINRDTIEIVMGGADLEEIERFRYSIYIAEQQKPLPTANHENRRLPDNADVTAVHFCIRNPSGVIVGYSRLHNSLDIPTYTISQLKVGDLLKKYPKSLAYISKLMVDKSLRGRTHAVSLVISMIKYSCENFTEVEGGVFHCIPQLVQLYARMGFRSFGEPFLDPHVGFQSPMVAIVRDMEHFQKCGSPIIKVVKTPPSLDAKLITTFRDYFLVDRASL